VDQRPLIERILLPGGPWWIALPCNLLAGVAIVLLVIDPDGNLPMALALLGPAALILYATVFFQSWHQRRRERRREEAEG
jgi:hypothetical protein